MNKYPNHLAEEKSPYLQQHAYNPVDWYPWGEEAFAKAEKENKPVFLSIGYSTCHWCHVMEKESFEDDAIAEMMNELFVPVKVDREERPDIDNVYMAVCQMLTGRGGWPLTIIMTPDKKPFFAGTYFPREARMGNPGLKEIIARIKKLWNLKRNDIVKSAEDICHSLTMSSSPRVSKEIDEAIFAKAFEELFDNFDEEYGGFGIAPKFPSPHNLLFLLRYWKRYENQDALKMAEKTLQNIRNGGIYDHIGFGIHRYSTNREWTVPHFEKMLYDQALIITAFTEAYQATGKVEYKTAAEEIITYVLRDMASPEGGFYSAEDADSENAEGKFYLWTEDEIKSALGGDAGLIIKVFNISKPDSSADHTRHSVHGASILHLRKSIAELAEELNIQPEEIRSKISAAREKLYKIREERIHPFKDKKILTDWNSLMISALAKAGAVFGNERYISAAVKAIDFLLENMLNEEGLLLHRYLDGEALLYANIDDYVFLIAALIDVYEAVFDSSYLAKALELNRSFIKYFRDEKEGGFFFTPVYGEKLLLRAKEIYDGAIPSGNSTAMLNLIRLAKITGDLSYEDMALKTIDVFSRNIFAVPSAYTQALAAMSFLYGPSHEIVICGSNGGNDTKELLETLNRHFIPNKTIILNSAEDETLKAAAPFAASLHKINDKATAYICTNTECGLPVNSAADLERKLRQL